ncbi:DUF6090 family protein [Winogradskyella schleiferi]|uniref:DUF6090 family protein n=1 Tax=Winogradskyella schleiferi TaxID=2686078 RepID=UPI0015BDCC11|nr:DUF6090 family protein [Winogradskyella schleiferi]
MIKFFRKVRQKLLTENKFSTYLLYAIGEIVLVVIGILIALSINNWNENRKTQEQEIQIYLELKSDLLKTRNDIQKIISQHREIFKLSQNLIKDIYNKKPYSDTIYDSFTSAGVDFQIIPKTSAFENLKNIGLNTLSNDSLRIDITNLFQLDLKRLDDELGMDRAEISIPTLLSQYQYKYLFADYSQPKKYGFKHSDSINIYKLKIKNYDKFLTDNDLLMNLQLALYNRGRKVDEEIKTIDSIDYLIKKIEEELKSITK